RGRGPSAAGNRARPPSPASTADAGMASWGRGSERLTAATWDLAAGLTFLSFGFTVMQGADLRWHTAGGRGRVEHGAIRAPDPFSYTTDGRYCLNDAWL